MKTAMGHDRTFSESETGSNLRKRLVSVNALKGVDVRNVQGESLGKIQEVMINLASRNVEYVVLEFGSFLGMGGKLFAIPFREFKFDGNNDALILNKEKEYLKDSPGFDGTHWPLTNEHNYFGTVDTYYGVVPPFP